MRFSKMSKTKNRKLEIFMDGTLAFICSIANFCKIFENPSKYVGENVCKKY
jgi:hypothetical protein